MGMILPPEVGDQSKYSVNPEVGSTVSPLVDMVSIHFKPPEVGTCNCICTNVLPNACGGKIQFEIQKAGYANKICSPPEVGGSKEISEAPEVSRLERSEADVT